VTPLRRLLMVQPCGAGKTRILAYYAEIALLSARREGRKPIVHLSFPALTLVDQTVEEFQGLDSDCLPF
jgi:hypothetical protein